jgi:hypothetical protein
MHPAITRLLAAEGLIVARGQMVAAGVSAEQIDRHVGRGDLVVMHRGVYRPGSVPATWLMELRAATVLAGPSAAVSHRAAAHLLGIGAPTKLVELIAPDGRGRRSGGLIEP